MFPAIVTLTDNVCLHMRKSFFVSLIPSVSHEKRFSSKEPLNVDHFHELMEFRSGGTANDIDGSLLITDTDSVLLVSPNFSIISTYRLHFVGKLYYFTKAILFVNGVISRSQFLTVHKSLLTFKMLITNHCSWNCCH